MKIKYFVFLSVLVFCLVFICSPVYADKIDGKIKSVDVATNTIDIGGVKISTQNALIQNEADMQVPLSALAPGNYVEIEGGFSGDGKMAAYKVEKDAPDIDKIKGMIGRVDASTRDIFIAGVKISVPAGAWIEGYNDMQIPFEQLAVGNYVGCKGMWVSDLSFTANKVELGD